MGISHRFQSRPEVMAFDKEDTKWTGKIYEVAVLGTICL